MNLPPSSPYPRRVVTALGFALVSFWCLTSYADDSTRPARQSVQRLVTKADALKYATAHALRRDGAGYVSLPLRDDQIIEKPYGWLMPWPVRHVSGESAPGPGACIVFRDGEVYELIAVDDVRWIEEGEYRRFPWGKAGVSGVSAMDVSRNVRDAGEAAAIVKDMLSKSDEYVFYVDESCEAPAGWTFRIEGYRRDYRPKTLRDGIIERTLWMNRSGEISGQDLPLDFRQYLESWNGRHAWGRPGKR